MSQDSESADTEPIELETQLNPTVEQSQEQDLQALLDQLHQERDSLNRLVQKLSLTGELLWGWTERVVENEMPEWDVTLLAILQRESRSCTQSQTAGGNVALVWTASCGAWRRRGTTTDRKQTT